MIKFALIGTGNLANRHASAIMSCKNTKLVAVYGKNRERTEKFAKKYHIQPYFSIEDLLGNNEIQAVDIVNMNNLHADIGTKAANKGKHVLVEKPIDVSLEKAEKLIKVCKENDVKLSVISQHRWDKSVVWLKNKVDNDFLGKLFLGRASIKWNRNKEYYEGSGGWRGKKETAGGGALIFQAIHYVDLLLWLFGDVESVYGKIDTRIHNIEVEDLGIGIIKFKSGAVAVIEGSTCVKKSLPNELEIHGEKASIILKDNGERNYIYLLNSNLKFLDKLKIKLFSKLGTIKDQVNDFVEAIENNREPLVKGEDGRNALEIVLAIYNSSKLKKEIKF